MSGTVLPRVLIGLLPHDRVRRLAQIAHRPAGVLGRRKVPGELRRGRRRLGPKDCFLAQPDPLVQADAVPGQQG